MMYTIIYKLSYYFINMLIYSNLDFIFHFIIPYFYFFQFVRYLCPKSGLMSVEFATCDQVAC